MKCSSRVAAEVDHLGGGDAPFDGVGGGSTNSPGYSAAAFSITLQQTVNKINGFSIKKIKKRWEMDKVK